MFSLFTNSVFSGGNCNISIGGMSIGCGTRKIEAEGQMTVGDKSFSKLFIETDDPITDIYFVGNCDSMTSTSGDVKVSGSLNSASSTSGDIKIQDIVTGNASTTSGDISCSGCDGRTKTVSGDIR